MQGSKVLEDKLNEMDNIRSAIPMGDSSNYLSPNEFQNFLRSWFEEKGVLSDLRSQLRYKMVNALRNTVIGKDIGKRTVQRISLSQQAVNIIVAEFLMQNKCHYSLSIFNAEAALMNMLPEYPINFENVTAKENEVCYFDKEYILNILELIGIAKTSNCCEELLTLYFSDQENNSILSCLISLLCKFAYNHNGKPYDQDLIAELIDLQKDCTFINEVGNILLHSKLPKKNLKIVLENIKSLYEVERENREKEHFKLISELQMKIKSQEEQIKKMQKANRAFNNHFAKVNKEYTKLKLHVKSLIGREKTLRQSYDCGEKPNEAIKDFSKTVNNNLKENKSVPNSSMALKNQNIVICRLPHCSGICETNVRRIEQLNTQNKILNEENARQKETINRLTVKYRNLTDEFTSCQSKINLLNSRINEGNTKELLQNILQEDNLTMPKVNLVRNVDSSDLSSDSLTEEVLHQSRLRLQKLEEESNEIEEKFKNLHQGIIHSFQF